MKRFNSFPLITWFKKHQKQVAVAVIILSLTLLAIYAASHPSVIQNVVQTDPRILALLLVLYLAVIGTQFVIMYATIKLCKKTLPIKNGVLLSIYSAVANFFGPLQSGPGVRAIYLKQKIGLRIRDYTLATLFYYFAFAAINGSLLFVNTLPFLTVFGFLVSILLIIIGTRLLKFENLAKFVLVIFLVTIAQILFMTIIYFVELHAINSPTNYTFLQALVYSASANLSLFVSITPGAIGIREAFIVFAQSLHHIPLSSVISAGILDRAFYILFLIMLFIVSSGMHLKDMFADKKTT